MHHARSLFLLGALAQAAAAFRFTGPSTDQPLDLSKLITVTWEADSGIDTTRYDSFELFFYGNDTAEANVRWAWYLAQEVANEDGSFEFNATWHLQANLDRDDREPHGFSDGQDYYFQADFSEGGETTRIASNMYRIENYELNAAGRAVVAPVVAMLGVAAAFYQVL